MRYENKESYAKVRKIRINLGLRPYFLNTDLHNYKTDGNEQREILYHTDRVVEKYPIISCPERLDLCCELNLFLIHRYTGEFSLRRNGDERNVHGKPISLKTVKSLADTLIPFVNWLVKDGSNWQEVIAEPQSITESSLELAPIWRYRNEIYHMVKSGVLNYSTARNRVNVVTSFYLWSYKNSRIKVLPFEVVNKVIRKPRKDGKFDVLFGMDLTKKRNGLPVFTTSMALPRVIKQKSATPTDALTPYRNSELAILLGSDTVSKNQTYQLWVKLGYMVGLREFECVLLNRDFVEEVSDKNKNGKYLTFIGKGNKERTVFITSQLMKELWEYINTALYVRRLNKFQIKHGVDEPIPLFINNRGNRMSASSPGNVIGYVRDELEVKKLKRLDRSFHDLRSTFATNLTAFLIKAGKSEGFIKYKLMSLLGHSGFETTKKYINFVNGDGFEKTMMSWVDTIYGTTDGQLLETDYE
ncbi:tyrosine-type recombinase/integrase [Aliivibrio fischeri]|nr:site-specific integrase [Aliivibrio fischeri]